MRGDRARRHPHPRLPGRLHRHDHGSPALGHAAPGRQRAGGRGRPLGRHRTHDRCCGSVGAASPASRPGRHLVVHGRVILDGGERLHGQPALRAAARDHGVTRDRPRAGSAATRTRTTQPPTSTPAPRAPLDRRGARGVREGTGEPGDATTEQLMANAIGGWRGVIDSSLPSRPVPRRLPRRRPASSRRRSGRRCCRVCAHRGAAPRAAPVAAAGAVGLHRRRLLRLARVAHRPGRGLLPARAAHQRRLRRRCSRSRASSATRCSGYAVGAATGDLTGWRQRPRAAARLRAGDLVLRRRVRRCGCSCRCRSTSRARSGPRRREARAWAGRCSRSRRTSPSGCITRAAARREAAARPRAASGRALSSAEQGPRSAGSWSGGGDEEQLVAGLEGVVGGWARSRGCRG